MIETQIGPPPLEHGPNSTASLVNSAHQLHDALLQLQPPDQPPPLLLNETINILTDKLSEFLTQALDSLNDSTDWYSLKTLTSILLDQPEPPSNKIEDTTDHLVAFLRRPPPPKGDESLPRNQAVANSITLMSRWFGIGAMEHITPLATDKSPVVRNSLVNSLSDMLDSHPDDPNVITSINSTLTTIIDTGLAHSSTDTATINTINLLSRLPANLASPTLKEIALSANHPRIFAPALKALADTNQHQAIQEVINDQGYVFSSRLICAIDAFSQTSASPEIPTIVSIILKEVPVYPNPWDDNSTFDPAYYPTRKQIDFLLKLGMECSDNPLPFLTDIIDDAPNNLIIRLAQAQQASILHTATTGD